MLTSRQFTAMVSAIDDRRGWLARQIVDAKNAGWTWGVSTYQEQLDDLGEVLKAMRGNLP